MCQTDVIKYTFIYTVKQTFIILTQNTLKKTKLIPSYLHN